VTRNLPAPVSVGTVFWYSLPAVVEYLRHSVFVLCFHFVAVAFMREIELSTWLVIEKVKFLN